AGATQRESICLAYKHAGSFGRAFRHYGAQNIPSRGSGEPSAAHFPESSPPSPCGLRLDSLRSLRWEFVARACPAGAREATLGSKKTPPSALSRSESVRKKSGRIWRIKSADYEVESLLKAAIESVL